MIQSSIITASAGSGKTYTVTTELLRLFLGYAVEPRKVLVTTFTKKAAQEIFIRLLSRMTTAIQDKNALELLKNELCLPTLTTEQIKQSLSLLISEQNNLKIQTIDSFFVALGQIFSLELEIPFQWKITEPWEDETVKLESLKQTIISLGLDKLKLILPLLFRNNQSTTIFSAVLKEIENLAKEILIVHSKSWKFEFDPFPENARNILDKNLFTIFKAKIDDLLDQKTITSQMHKGLLTFYTQFINQEIEELLISTIGKSIFRRDFTYNKKQIPEELRPELSNIIFYSANKLAESLNNQSLGLGAIFSEFLNQKFEFNKNQGLLSFQDLTSLLATNRQSDNLTELYYRLDSKIDFVFIDEFQDTSAMQWQILRPLIEEIVNETGNNRALIAVGDSKQAIYGWRGGLRDIFSLIKNQFKNVTEKPLSSSYRSSPIIIDFVNSVFSSPVLTPEFHEIKDLWSKNFIKHDSKSNLKSGSVNIFNIKHSKEKSVLNCQILELIKDRILLERENRPGSTVGILTKTNKQALLIESYLGSFNIPLSTISSNKLSSFYETQLIISCLTLALHPQDNLSYYHIQGLPALKQSIKGLNRSETSSLYRKDIYRHGLGGFISGIFKTIAITTKLNKNITDHILYLSAGLERKNGIDISGMIRVLLTCSLNNEGNNLVSILTIHKSKGLEFDHVIIPFTSDPFFSEQKLGFLKDQPDPFTPPSSVIRSCKKDARIYFPELERMVKQTKATRISEALCLSYVAITRAKESLSIFIQSKENYNSENELSFRSLLVNTLNLELSPSETKLIYSKESEAVVSSLVKLKSIKEASTKAIFSSPLEPNFSSYLLAKNLGIISPSRIINEDLNNELDLLETSDDSDKELGIEIHSILSLFKQPFSSTVELNDYFVKNFKDSTSQKAVDLISNFIKSPLAGEILVSNLESETSIKIRTEYPIRQIINNKLVSGRIDRLVINLNNFGVAKIDLTDFKLGGLEKPSYIQQIEMYKDLIAKQFKIPKSKVNAKLVSISKLIEINV